MERRMFHRFVDLPLKVTVVRDGSDDEIEVIPVDLGIGGLKIECSVNLQMYEKCLVKISAVAAGERKSLCEADSQVWRIEPYTDEYDGVKRFVAFRFRELPVESREKIVEFLTDYVVNCTIEED